MSRARAEAGKVQEVLRRLRRAAAQGGLLSLNDQSPFLDLMIQTVHPRTQTETVAWGPG